MPSRFQEVEGGRVPREPGALWSAGGHGERAGRTAADLRGHVHAVVGGDLRALTGIVDDSAADTGRTLHGGTLRLHENTPWALGPERLRARLVFVLHCFQ